MEVLLLDTTEKEGEDNTLYHYAQQPSTSKAGVGRFSTSSLSTGAGATRWLDLRGVLAAAVGATTSLCGESLRTAVFNCGDSEGPIGIVGFVNIYEVLYALAFSDTDLPKAVVEYYTRSSCDLILSFFGYPDGKLSRWRRRDGGSISSSTLTSQLDSVFRGVFATIQNDLSFHSHLHFAFDGRIPAVNYPLTTIAKLAALDVPLGDNAPSKKYAAVGRCVLYRKQLVFSTMRSDLLRLLFQWLLFDNHFTPDSGAVKPPTSSNNAGDLVPTQFDVFELHDFRFARHGEYPKRHAFLLVTHGNLQLVYLVERNLNLEGKLDAATWATRLQDDINQQCVESLGKLCATDLEKYLENTEKLHQQHMESLSEGPKTSGRLRCYSVALDRLRGVIIGDSLPEVNAGTQEILGRFIQHVIAFQLSTNCMHDAPKQTSPEVPSGIPPVKVDVNDPDTLFLRESPTSDSGDDISAGDTNIFPQLRYMEVRGNKWGRPRREIAERFTVNGQSFWFIASCFVTLEFFSIVDASLPLEVLEHEMNRLCAFGGAAPVESS